MRCSKRELGLLDRTSSLKLAYGLSLRALALCPDDGIDKDPQHRAGGAAALAKGFLGKQRSSKNENWAAHPKFRVRNCSIRFTAPRGPSLLPRAIDPPQASTLMSSRTSSLRRIERERRRRPSTSKVYAGCRCFT